MKLSIRRKLFAASLALVVLSLLAAELYLRPAIESILIDGVRDEIFVRLALVEHTAETRLGSAGVDRAVQGLGSAD